MSLASQLRSLGIDPDRCTTADGKPLADEPSVKRARMNKWETAYSLELEEAKRRGEIAAWWFEAFKLRLADRTWYTPDFLLLHASGKMGFIEIKGFAREDAMVKFKVAREQYQQFDWAMLRKTKHGWEVVL